MSSRIKCRRPIVVRTTGGRSTVRCGRCRGCRVRHKMAWTGRLLLEANRHEHNRVLTLTYNTDEKRFAPLLYSDIQEFLKNRREYMRANVDPEFKHRFWVCGEYGEESGHAHWHMILFGEKTWQPEWMTKAAPIEMKYWTDRHGFASDMRLDPVTAAYCCGYTLKKGENEKPFMRLSLKPSIGFPALDHLAQCVFSKCGQQPIPAPTWLNISGKKYPLNDGALKRFEKTYTALGGHLTPKPSSLQREIAADFYTRTDEYLSQHGKKAVQIEEQIRVSQPTKNERLKAI